MNTEKANIPEMNSSPDGFISGKEIKPSGEVEGVFIELISIKGPNQVRENASPAVYDVLLFLKGSALFETESLEYNVAVKCIARPAYNKPYAVRVKKGNEIHFLRWRKSLDQDDLSLISQDKANHLSVYIKAIDSCPAYTEDIKSSKTLNRMILPEGMVPRFCMGSVETEGPDSVGEHEHPMLDQLFYGLEGCKCTCIANGEEVVLTENMMLHIPLGSQHSVSVEKGDRLAYIWMDFFLTLEGQKYMNEQHHLEEDKTK
jgi:quercetin dioxygenase-like cupin family protein